MSIQANAEHDPQHQQEVEALQYVAPTYEELGTQKHAENELEGKQEQGEVDKQKPPKMNIYTYRPASYLYAQTRLEHKLVGAKAKPDPDALVSGMNMLGYSTNTYKGTSGGSYSKSRYLLTGTVEQWKKLLSDVNSHHDFDKYVTPFLAEAQAHPHTIDKADLDKPTDSVIRHSHKRYGKINDQDILNFLLALYGYDVGKTPSNLDFPNTMWDSDSNTEFANKYSQALTGFIHKYQHTLVKYLSENGKFIESADAKKLAQQADFRGAMDGDQSVKTMMNSAICSAFIGAARVFNAKISHGITNVGEEEAIGVNMIRNSGHIIGGALAHKAATIANIETDVKGLLGVIWGQVPIAKPLNLLFDIYKVRSIGVLSSKFKIGGENKDIAQYKENIVSAFASTIFNTFKQQELGEYQKLVAEKYNVNLAVSNVTGEWYGNLTANFSSAMNKK